MILSCSHSDHFINTRHFNLEKRKYEMILYIKNLIKNKKVKRRESESIREWESGRAFNHDYNNFHTYYVSAN